MATRKKFYLAIGQGIDNVRLEEKEQVLELSGGCLKAPLKQKISDGKFIGFKELSTRGNSFEVTYDIATA